MLSTTVRHSRKSSNLILDFVLRKIRGSRGFVRIDVRRKLICFALISSLLILPGPGIGLNEVRTLASTAVDLTTSPIRFLHPILKSLFGFGARSRPQRETLADRIARVSHVRISPFKLVGYVGEGATFIASPTDSSDRTIQGVKFDWESSDPQKLQIDEAGRATFLQPGRVWITCRAGNASASAPVLIRPNHRPVQSDSEWRSDQNRLDEDGNVVGELGGAQATLGAAGSLLDSLVDKLAPTAYAQGGSTDLIYPELWTESRNLAGSPRNRAMEATAMGAVLPEGSNFEWAAPIVGLGGRGVGTSLALRYNSRVWTRRASAMAFDAISGWPAPGYSLGFGRIIVYDIGFGQNPACKFLLVDPDGTLHYWAPGPGTASVTRWATLSRPQTGRTSFTPGMDATAAISIIRTARKLRSQR